MFPHNCSKRLAVQAFTTSLKVFPQSLPSHLPRVTSLPYFSSSLERTALKHRRFFQAKTITQGSRLGCRFASSSASASLTSSTIADAARWGAFFLVGSVVAGGLMLEYVRRKGEFIYAESQVAEEAGESLEHSKVQSVNSDAGDSLQLRPHTVDAPTYKYVLVGSSTEIFAAIHAIRSLDPEGPAYTHL